MEIWAPFRCMFWERNGIFTKVCSCENKHIKCTHWDWRCREVCKGSTARGCSSSVGQGPPGHIHLRLSSSWGQLILSPSPSQGAPGLSLLLTQPGIPVLLPLAAEGQLHPHPLAGGSRAALCCEGLCGRLAVSPGSS